MKPFTRYFLIAGVVLTILLTHFVEAVEPEAEEKGIELGLFNSQGWNVTYDPRDPSISPVLSLEIVNRSSRAITLPATYDGAVLRLWGASAEERRPVVLQPSPQRKGNQVFRLTPGERRTCFSLKLSEILDSTQSERVGRNEQKWLWSWDARPNPPLTPVHRRRDNRLVSVVVFWAEIIVDNQSLRTEPLIIPVIGE
ncbi:MAG: hypothetical protein WD669_07345 [Pirellulales bacterium]